MVRLQKEEYRSTLGSTPVKMENVIYMARLGGDEFAILLTPLHNAQYIADKVVACIDAPIELLGIPQIISSLNIGIALYSEHSATPGALLNAVNIGDISTAVSIAFNVPHRS
ncbi:diguanylate cyclase [Pseudomonas sp. SWRI22]|nr:diguanylate cyclase [Pseudomonas sp. SWRI22]